MNTLCRVLTVISCALLSNMLAASVAAQPSLGESPATIDSLASGFSHPPDSARPWVYWFWLNGNITREGITADLEAMQRVGIGGVLIMEVDQGAPAGPVDFMSSSWRELFQHVQQEAQRLGLEVNMNNDAGWNGSGGPWIEPARAMQKVVWSETEVTGPIDFVGALPQPDTVAGHYRDICVLAFSRVGEYRIDRVKGKAMFEVRGVGGIARDKLPAAMRIDGDKIAVISRQMNNAGRLKWKVPAGAWTIVRFGHTCTGVENAPAPASGRGLECDKLSKQGIATHFANMMSKLTADTHVGPNVGTTGLVATHIDSWENGSQNWTAAMPEEFERRRGYDMIPFLPVMTGRVIDSLEISERFLWDLRQTVSELVLENYAGHMRQLAHAHGMRFTVEAYGCPCDSLPYAGRSDEPMGEFWTPTGAIETCKTMASAAHVYGKEIVGAEAFTSGDQEKWREHPALLKALGDRVFCEGVNRFVFHRYALQPWKQRRVPGMTMGPWGQHYERTQTWWDWSRDWHQYLARCQHLLRQGLFVADICYLQPEAPPQGPRDYPRHGYAWDACPPEIVLNKMTVEDGRLLLPDGMGYRVLVLPNSQTMTPQLLRKIKDLVAAGATVIGPRPSISPSLTDFPNCDKEIKRLGAELWANCDGQNVKERSFGQGHLVWGITPEDVFERRGVPPDFVSDESVNFIHRQVADLDLYFVANPHPYEIATTCSFRVTGKAPEFWWPESGRVERATVYREDDNVTHVAIPLSAAGSVFVVFRGQQRAADSVVELTRNGKTLVSATPAPPVQVTVTEARYGVLNDRLRTRDVTGKVQLKVDNGDYRFAVSELAKGDDPAQGVVKTLIVNYTIEGKPYAVKAIDGSAIWISANAVPVRIDKARYGVLNDPQRTRDVREKLQQLLAAGESSFRVARMAAGDDPAFLVVKTLELEYTLNERHVRVTGTDPDLIDLAPAAIPPPLAAMIHTDQDGTALLEVRETGEYRWTTNSGRQQGIEIRDLPSPVSVTGPWRVSFAPTSDNSSAVTFPKLMSWSEYSDSAVKYFSGIATYTKSFDLSGNLLTSKHSRLDLELGEVQVMARVVLNGINLGTLWHPPFRVDITKAAQSGKNILEVQVVNLWPNRMIGDEYLPEDSQRHPNGTLKVWPQWLIDDKVSPTGRHTFTSWRLWKKDDALLPSGLLGPVTLQPRNCFPMQTR